MGIREADVAVIGCDPAQRLLALALGRKGHGVVFMLDGQGRGTVVGAFANPPLLRVLGTQGLGESAVTECWETFAAALDARLAHLGTVEIRHCEEALELSQNGPWIEIVVRNQATGWVDTLRVKHLVKAERSPSCYMRDENGAGRVLVLGSGMAVRCEAAALQESIDLAWRLDLVLSGLAGLCLLREFLSKREWRQELGVVQDGTVGGLLPVNSAVRAWDNAALDAACSGRFTVLAAAAVLVAMSDSARAFLRAIDANLVALDVGAAIDPGFSARQELASFMQDVGLCAFVVRPDLRICTAAPNGPALEQALTALAARLGYEEQPKNRSAALESTGV